MEKKNFKTVDEVVEYLNEKCYSKYTNTYEERDGKLTHSLDVNEVLKNIEIDGMKKYLSQDGKNYDIYFGLDCVVAIFVTQEDKIEYIWEESNFHDFNEVEYHAMAVDNEEIANAIAEYPQYVKDGGCLDVSAWLLEEYCDSWLSIDYNVMTTIGRIWC